MLRETLMRDIDAVICTVVSSDRVKSVVNDA